MWPPLMREPMAAAYLTDEKGLPTTAKTLRNQRHQRRGPKSEYYGAMVLYRKAVLDDYAENEALQPESPPPVRAALHEKQRDGRSHQSWPEQTSHEVTAANRKGAGCCCSVVVERMGSQPSFSHGQVPTGKPRPSGRMGYGSKE